MLFRASFCQPCRSISDYFLEGFEVDGVLRRCPPTLVPSFFVWGATDTIFFPSFVCAIAELQVSTHRNDIPSTRLDLTATAWHNGGGLGRAVGSPLQRIPKARDPAQKANSAAGPLDVWPYCGLPFVCQARGVIHSASELRSNPRLCCFSVVTLQHLVDAVNSPQRLVLLCQALIPLPTARFQAVDGGQSLPPCRPQ